MRKTTDVAALILGWAFVAAALFLLLRSGGLLRLEIDAALKDRHRARIVAESWPELAQEAPVVGSGNASPIAIEFIDYQCVYCRRFHQTLDSIANVSELGIRLAIRHNPNPANPTSRKAALASICARFQGEFESLHNYLMTSHDWYDSADWRDVSAAAGIPEPDSLVSCLASERADSVLSIDSHIASTLDLRATPAFAIQGQGLVIGPLAPEEVERLAVSVTRK
ncbi:MAG: thioredoxin domain-containing protein [Gemmatimonadetes bacterium]|nr:thioredoxin domain-containing protein [Gemmatimonadota bacterium]MYA63388.1 thioredoxin domain-containing protein [Gemmatimonadota bacterium]MYB97578.1 thioredoxin domain-containing protein [Gemmatimonadota bacterium]MYH53345.1 thioredoxin domain-containing protein [Gemmatimonadota bacterium]MYI45936.1 thioredoxin domain-containing protein [Gemmatimonadota bacterium]